MKKLLKGVLVAFGILFLIGLFAGESEPVDPVEHYDIQVTRTYNDGFALYIEGTLVADDDYGYLEIQIPVYDAAGNKVDTAWANVNNIHEGERWRFEAMSLSDGVKYDIHNSEVTGW